ncbi:MAG TPA: class I SAM-dependent methyltransferase, partial [Burkholderiaceae bacterium]|nr:class I SAM-dependent methyltransferase [Burkholderiaceae bacterium]
MDRLGLARRGRGPCRAPGRTGGDEHPWNVQDEGDLSNHWAPSPGCANGELSAALAQRCDRLLISNGAQAAVESARWRVAGAPHVSVIRAWALRDRPDGRFDLIVISEVAYYLSVDDLDTLVAKACALAHGDACADAGMCRILRADHLAEHRLTRQQLRRVPTVDDAAVGQQDDAVEAVEQTHP